MPDYIEEESRDVSHLKQNYGQQSQGLPPREDDKDKAGDEDSVSHDNPLQSLQTLSRIPDLPKWFNKYLENQESKLNLVEIDENTQDDTSKLLLEEMLKSKMPKNMNEVYRLYKNKDKKVLKGKTY